MGTVFKDYSEVFFQCTSQDGHNVTVDRDGQALWPAVRRHVEHIALSPIPALAQSVDLQKTKDSNSLCV